MIDWIFLLLTALSASFTAIRGAGDGAVKNMDVPRERIAEFSRKHGIRRLAIFGSALREDFGPDSDVEVFV